MGKKSRDLGKVGERMVAILFRTVYPKAARSRDQYTGGERPDVEGTPFWLEGKYWDRYPDLYAALEQAKTDAFRMEDDRLVVAVTKRKNANPNLRKPWIATMYADDFITLCEELEHWKTMAEGNC